MCGFQKTFAETYNQVDESEGKKWKFDRWVYSTITSMLFKPFDITIHACKYFISYEELRVG